MGSIGWHPMRDRRPVWEGSSLERRAEGDGLLDMAGAAEAAHAVRASFVVVSAGVTRGIGIPQRRQPQLASDLPVCPKLCAQAAPAAGVPTGAVICVGRAPMVDGPQHRRGRPGLCGRPHGLA